MTVAELEASMPNSEYVEWAMFHDQRRVEAELERKMSDARQRGKR